MIEMTLDMAERAVRVAREKARALGTPMTVTVVDEAGRLVLCARGDGTGFFTPETSRAKAMAAGGQRDQAIAALRQLGAAVAAIGCQRQICRRVRDRGDTHR